MSLDALSEHYEIGDMLGRGGFGVVYRARHRLLQREVALKVLHMGAEQDRFVREGQLLARLRHRNLVEIFDCGVVGNTFYLAIELVEGETLMMLLQQAPLTMAETVWVITELLEGLAEAHRQGIWHRDVKPSNVLIGAGGGHATLKLLDFGVAKDELGEKLTAEGALVGTARYVSPEMLRGAPGSAQTDLWAVGVLACECATGRPAYPGAAPGIFGEILAGPPKALSHLAGTELGPVLTGLLAPAERRLGSAKEALELLKLLPREPIGTRRLGNPTLFGTLMAPAAAPHATAIPNAMPTLPAKALSKPTKQHSAKPKTRTSPSWVHIAMLGVALLMAMGVGSTIAVLSTTAPDPVQAPLASPVPTPPETPPTQPAHAELPRGVEVQAPIAAPETAETMESPEAAAEEEAAAPMVRRRRGPRCRGGTPEQRQRWRTAIRCALETSGETRRIRVTVEPNEQSGFVACLPPSQFCVDLYECGPFTPMTIPMTCTTR